MNQTPPLVVVQKKRDIGCFGIGCVVLLITILLVVGVMAGIGYYFHSKVMTVTQTVPGQVPSFDGGDDMYRAATQKWAAFNQAVNQNQPATVELTADEINTMIARNADLAANQVHLFVAMTGNVAKVQGSFPTNLLAKLLPVSMFKDRFLNFDISFIPGFDPDSKSLSLVLQGMTVGAQTYSKDDIAPMQNEIDSILNVQMQTNPDMQRALGRVKTLEIRDGKLEIATQ